MNKKYLFVFGMFRSGTTLISKILSSNNKIVVASDPYFQFFKSFRNEIALNSYKKKKFDLNSPLDDYFFKKKNKILNQIINKTFNLKINKVLLNKTIKNIKIFSKRDSEKIIPYLSKVKSKNYKDLLEKLIEVINIAYGNKITKYVGFKTVFAEEFIQTIFRTFNDSKCICIIRDPRAIYASQVKFAEKNKFCYPILYVVRHWRKSIYFIKKNSKNKNLILIKYEDLIKNPEKNVIKLCNFLNIKFSRSMINPKSFKDGKGKRWFQNSSFKKSQKINNKSVNIWKYKLSKNQIQFIEDTCQKEMSLFGYKRITANKIKLLKNLKIEEKRKNIFPWLLKCKKNYLLNKKNINEEINRYKNSN